MDKFILHMAKHMPKKELVSELKRRIAEWESDQTEENWKHMNAIVYMMLLKDSIDDHGGVDSTAKMVAMIKEGVELMQRMNGN